MSDQAAAIIGLGNPGDRYQDTRHNVGFMVIDHLVGRYSFREEKANRLTTLHRGKWAGWDLFLGKPQTFMNLSGQAVNWIAGSKKIPPERVLVVVDEFALPLGKLRIRGEGSAGGHNGLKSIIADLGTQKFPRLRMGIGPLPEGWQAENFVLGRFRPEERAALGEMIEKAADCVECWLKEGLEKAMNLYNR